MNHALRITIKKLVIALLTILLIFTATPSIHAKDHNPILKNSSHAKIGLKLDADTQKFEIMGEITAIAGNNFMVSDQTIFIDPTLLANFKQKGILEAGKRVKVEGIIQNDIKFAQTINVIGTGQGRFKFETVNNPIPGTTAGSNIQVKVKANGPIQQVETFLEQILALLKSLIS